MNKKGVTLLEVVIFISILSIVMLAAAGYTVRLISTMKVNEHKLRAQIYAEEVKTWLDGERENSWQNVFNKSENTAVKKPTSFYCMNSHIAVNYLVTSLPARVTSCAFSGVTGRSPAIFSRRLYLTRPNANQIRAFIEVVWRENNVEYRESVEALYTNY